MQMLPVSQLSSVLSHTNTVQKCRREQILHLEAVMRNFAEDHPGTWHVKHHFAPGNYARECFIQAGTTVTGKIHKHAHINVISQGSCLVMTESGGLQELSAPLTFVSTPGTKRAVTATSDLIWTTIHPTDETDLEKIEDQVIAKSYDEYHLLEQAKMKELT